ncbi:MAG: adenine nucleotide alpha hydrolase [Sulfuriflexus sp.]|nr:adenine nucleotide alpha hydrolase [Sulfuriflexus sp.]
MTKPVFLSWSSGKDSAWTLHTLQQDPDYEVIALVTTVNEKYKRVAMHGVREQILQQQADVAGLPLHTLNIPSPCTNNEYETVMKNFLHIMHANNVDIMAFGDLYLEDIRQYREKQLAGTGIIPLFPLWQQPTRQLAEEMIDGGLEATITCIDPRKLSSDFAGRRFDHDFINDLPEHVDPCGENGEFHSCVHNGPMFNHPIVLNGGDIVERDNFIFADLIPTPLSNS